MMVDDQGLVNSVPILSDLQAPQKWILLKGCSFDSRAKSQEEITNFNPNLFSLNMKGVINPW